MASSCAPRGRIRLSGLAIVCALLASGFTNVNAADDAAIKAARASLERIQALPKERAGDGVLVLYEAAVHLRLGERDAAFELLRTLQGRKLGLIPARDSGFDEVWDDAEFQKIRQALADDEPTTPTAPVAFRLNDPKLIPEGIAFDPTGKRFFLGSMAQRKIIVTDGSGEVRDFSSGSDKLDAVLGLTVDAPSAQLYAVSSNGFLDEAKKERRNAVVRYDLKSGRLVARFAAPDAMQLNDVAVAKDATVYATDSMGGTLFRKRPDEARLSPFGETGALRGVNGIALAADGALYVAISTGIARVAITSGAPTRLPQPDNVATAAIDGLYWRDGDLFGVQNVTNPGRVIRVALSGEGSRIAGITVLQSHRHPEFDEPTTGAIANGALHVIANSYVGHYQPDGTIKDADALKPTAILAVPLKAD
jgi:sugar lactone lactonase YvrE